MKLFTLMAVLLAATGVLGQCPFPAKLTSTGICPGGVLTVAAAKNISKIDWVRDGAVVSTVTATASYNPVGITVAGGNGPGLSDKQLDHPQGIYVDAAGNILVADQNNNRIQAWPVGATTGYTEASSYGAGSDPLVSPASAFPDAYGHLYITYNTKHRIEKWTFPIHYGPIVAGGNGIGNAPNQFNSPVGIFLDHNGNLYVADQNNHRVQRFESGSLTGVTVAGGNGAGAAANQLQFPTAVFVDEAGNVYVVDNANHRVQKWAPGAASGVTVAGGNGAGPGANQLQNPYGVYVDGFGNIFIADAGNHRVQQWIPGATSGITVAGGNGSGSGSNQLNDPRFVWLDYNGNLYVSDNLNHRVQKFTLQNTINNTYTAPSPGVYTAVVTFATGCKESSANSITIEGTGTPSINITASANPINICTNATFTAATTHAGSNPSFQWKVNGANVGTNQPAFQTGALQNGDVVTCVLTPNDACISNSPLSSNAITTGVNGLPQATMISKNAFCAGDTLAIKSADSLLKIVWMQSGSPVKTVTTNPVGTAITVAGGNGQGAGANQLFFPTGATLDVQGNLYISDLSNRRVMKYAPGATSGTSVTNVQLAGSNAAAVDAAGNVYIVTSAGDVGKFPPGGGNYTTVAGANLIGSDANQLNTPVFLFLDDANNLYIADYWNYRVQKWAPGATTGVTVAGGNYPGLNNDQIAPNALFVDKAGNIFIADNGNRVMKWAPGATSGVEILGPSDINFGPRGIWVDNDGNLYLTSWVDNSVKKFAPGSKVGVTIAGGNGAGSGANQFDGPGGICMDAQGNLYVTDFYNNRVQKILQHPTIDTVYKATAPGTYTAEVTTSGGCVLGTNTIIVKPAVNPAVSVVSSAAQVCAGTPVTFTATPSNEGTAPVYAWQVNGIDAGVSGPSFTITPGNGLSSIVCKMTSNADCALQPTAASSPVAISVSTAVTPSVSINTSATTICSGTAAAFAATPVNGGLNPVFQWTVNGNPVGTNSPNFSSSSLNDGDVVACQLSSNATCVTNPTAPSNSISMRVKPVVPPLVNIKADPNPVCSGLPVTFLAEVTNGGVAPRYQWQVNGINAGGAGSNGTTYTTTRLNNGDAVTCLVSTNDGCALATSNIIDMEVNPTPVIEPNQVFTSTLGGVLLTPKVSGNIVTWAWSPAGTLSAVDIANPIANPQRSTEYMLKVVSGDGCTASGVITVKVYSDIRIPGAFSPNGDAKNDVFYILGAPQGSTIRNFAVFDRWGMKVFGVPEVIPGDPSFGWNGYFKGVPAAAGTYVYTFSVTLAGGGQQIYKGTVILLR